MRLSRLIALPILTLALASGSQTLRAESLPLWEIGAGVVLLARPDYPGADEESLYLLPFPNVIYRGDFIKANDKGIKGLLFDSDRVELDISGGGSLPVNSDNNGERENLPDLDPAFELGPSLTLKLIQQPTQRLTASLKWRAMISVDFPDMKYEGWVLNPELEWHQQLSENLEYGASIESLYGNRSYNGFFYDIPAAYASAELPTYRSRSGHHSFTTALFLSYQPAADWRIRGRIGYMNLDNATFDDSPLFKQDHGLYFSLMVSKIFFKSCTRHC